jgi:hypothetical protein
VVVDGRSLQKCTLLRAMKQGTWKRFWCGFAYRMVVWHICEDIQFMDGIVGCFAEL